MGQIYGEYMGDTSEKESVFVYVCVCVRVGVCTCICACVGQYVCVIN